MCPVHQYLSLRLASLEHLVPRGNRLSDCCVQTDDSMVPHVFRIWWGLKFQGKQRPVNQVAGCRAMYQGHLAQQ